MSRPDTPTMPPESPRARRVGAVWLPVLLCAALALRLVFFGGLLGWDDLEYWEGARALRAGHYVPTSTFQLRYTLTVPLAVGQAWLGEGEWVLALVPFAYSAAHLALAWGVGLLLGGASLAAAAVALLAIVPLDVIAATDLHSDLTLAVFLGASVYAMLRGEREPRRAGAWLGLAGVALGLATATKEVALALLPVLILRLWLVNRWAAEATYRWLVAGFIAVAVAEMAWLGIVTGDPLYRYRGPIAGYHAATMLPRPPGYAWMLVYPDMLLNPSSGSFGYFAGIFYLVAASTVWALRRSQPTVGQLGVWWGCLLVLFNFAPLDASFTRPLFHHFARTLHPLLMPFALSAALWLLVALQGRGRLRMAVGGAVVVLAAIGIVTTHADYHAWTVVARQATPVIERLPAEARVVTDPVTAAQLRFLLPGRRGRIASYTDSAGTTGGEPLFVLSDPQRLAEAGRRGHVPPESMTTPPASWEAVTHFPRPQRRSLRGDVWRVFDRGPATTTGPDGAVLWRVKA